MLGNLLLQPNTLSTNLNNGDRRLKLDIPPELAPNKYLNNIDELLDQSKWLQNLLLHSKVNLSFIYFIDSIHLILLAKYFS
jgi:hypothetical protein